MSNSLSAAKGPAKFFSEDIVCSVDNKQERCVVLRCWHDSEDLPLPPQGQADDPLLRPLKKGEVGLSSLISGERRIVKESDYELVDRSFQPGDVCKRSFEDVTSGVVLETHVQVKLEHAINGSSASGWIGYEELESAIDFFVGDHVVCDDWVGLIEESFDEITGQLVGGELFRIAEIGSRFRVGDRGLESLATTTFPNMFACLGSPPEVIIQIKPFVVAINWLAINQSLDKEESEHRKRPQRFWSGPDMARLTVIRPRPEVMVRIGERVVFRDASLAESNGVKFTRHGKDDNVIEVDTMVVRETRSEVTILWQDGTKERLLSTTLIPYINVDEYDCWPGDYVLWKGEDEKRVAVVQSVFSSQRTAEVLWYPPSLYSPSQGIVSSLELDPHGGSSGEPPSAQHELFGVRRGDFVFIHRYTNGSELPKVPNIGEVESWVRENGWRLEMVNLGVSVLEAGNGKGRPPEYKVDKFGSNIRWFGEVTNLRLNGDIEVTLPCGDVELVPLSRLTLLEGSYADMVDMWGDEYSDIGAQEMDGVTEEIVYEDDWAASRDNDQDDEGQSVGSWETYDDGLDAFDHMEVDADGDIEMVAARSVETLAPVSLPPKDISPIFPPTPTPSPPSHYDPPGSSFPSFGTATSDPSSSTSTARSSTVLEPDIDLPWERFSILSSAPLDHAFYSRTLSSFRPSKAFNSRLSKEYKVLSTSLPDTILVRAYEDRTDLLRCLIIGPENTPYEDAPFVIDWYLDATFPQTPPVAHFHSWTNGNGRVNPNLYEEGKVCLSILGTWTGDKSESWSAGRSSLLQAFVSIQGLVLVREPWFCEPAFDKLRGTEEGIVNSRLYNEKAYVLARGFVRRAMEVPPGGLESEIEFLYFTRGRLDKVLRDANILIEKSEKEDGNEIGDAYSDRAVKWLTAGAVLPLKRTLVKLQQLLDGRSTA